MNLGGFVCIVYFVYKGVVCGQKLTLRQLELICVARQQPINQSIADKGLSITDSWRL